MYFTVNLWIIKYFDCYPVFEGFGSLLFTSFAKVLSYFWYCQLISTCKHRFVIDMLMAHAFRECIYYIFSIIYISQRYQILTKQLRFTHFWIKVEIYTNAYFYSTDRSLPITRHMFSCISDLPVIFFICTYFSSWSARNLKLLYREIVIW